MAVGESQASMVNFGGAVTEGEASSKNGATPPNASINGSNQNLAVNQTGFTFMPDASVQSSTFGASDNKMRF